MPLDRETYHYGSGEYFGKKSRRGKGTRKWEHCTPEEIAQLHAETGADMPSMSARSGSSGGGSVPELVRAVGEAQGKAGSLMVIAATISVIGIVGGVLLVLMGVFILPAEQWWGLGIALIAAGITNVLAWTLVGSFAQTVAAGVRVLAALAVSQRA